MKKIKAFLAVMVTVLGFVGCSKFKDPVESWITEYLIGEGSTSSLWSFTGILYGPVFRFEKNNRVAWYLYLGGEVITEDEFTYVVTENSKGFKISMEDEIYDVTSYTKTRLEGTYTYDGYVDQFVLIKVK